MCARRTRHEGQMSRSQSDMHLGTTELTVAEINAKFAEYMTCHENAEKAAAYIFDSLVEDLIMGLLFEFHHGLKTGLTDLLEGEPEREEPLLIVNAPDCDVFGLSANKKTPDSNCCCPNCERPVSATRFAPHLEKCMGMGRNSSRIASRRIASNSKEPTLYAGMSDDDDDADWVGGERKKKKMRSNGVKKQAKLNNGSSKVTATNGGSSDGAGSSQEGGGATFETMTPNERKNLLLQVCGVVSEHTKKICTRSVRCPQHTEEQRKALRNSVLVESALNIEQNSGDGSTPLTPNDVGSPPDSSPSSGCSSSSRKRDKHRSKSSKGRREKNNHSPGRD